MGGQPVLLLLDAQEQMRAALGPIELERPATGARERRPEGSLVLFEPQGAVIWKAP